MTDTQSSTIQAFVSMQTKHPETFNPRIDPRDEMLLFDLPAMGNSFERTAIHYLSQGRVIRDNLRQIVHWHCGGFHQIGWFLDFASGYGRLTRYLVQEMDPARIWISDIYSDAVAFQEREFGVHGVASTYEPERYPAIGAFDCIYVGSLFSHLPEKTFTRWLKQLYSMLSPGGLLAFSVLDVSRIPEHHRRPEGGYVFSPTSESRSLDPAQYGITHVSESFVAGQIARATHDQGHWLRIPLALAGHQDIYALSNRPLRPGLCFHQNPRGWLDVARYLPDGRIHFEGWTLDVNPTGAIRHIQIYAGANLLWTGPATFARPDVAKHFRMPADILYGWRCVLPPDAAKLADIITIKVQNTQNLDSVVLVEPLADLTRRLTPTPQPKSAPQVVTP